MLGRASLVPVAGLRVFRVPPAGRVRSFSAAAQIAELEARIAVLEEENSKLRNLSADAISFIEAAASEARLRGCTSASEGMPKDGGSNIARSTRMANSSTGM